MWQENKPETQLGLQHAMNALMKSTFPFPEHIVQDINNVTTFGLLTMMLETSVESQTFDIKDMRPAWRPIYDNHLCWNCVNSFLSCKLASCEDCLIGIWLGVAYPGGIPNKKNGYQGAHRQV